ncbi:MAG: LysM peptidoglycan-binding domain-containing protein, partial [Anaerolineae bacterium]|nr:LysM peptidoglycan-binding domain-containing protein [Anaerolineae bacterium]
MRRLIIVFCALILAFGLTASVELSTAQNQVTYIVKPGDTLFKIALNYQVTVSAIVAANNIPNPNLIYVGQQLIIPTGGVPPTPPPGTTPQPTPPPGGETVYIVVPGDTLFKIATRFGTTVSAIAIRNGITNINL